MSFENRDYYRQPAGRVFGGGMSRHSMVTWLICINAGVFVLDSILGGAMRGGVLAPSKWGAFTVEQGIYGFQAWRWVTYQFLHAGFFHILFNMIGLYFFGPMLEKWWGSRRFVVFYVLCGCSGAVLFSLLTLIAPNIIFNVDAMARVGLTPEMIPVVGASGSLFGILAGAALIAPDTRVMLLFPPIPMKLRTMAMVFLGIAMFSLITGGHNAGGEAAHLGGAVLGFLLVKKPRLLDWADRVSIGDMRGKMDQSRRDRVARRDANFEREVDRVLDKVRAEGLQSLTDKEKKVLTEATDKKNR